VVYYCRQGTIRFAAVLLICINAADDCDHKLDLVRNCRRPI